MKQISDKDFDGLFKSSFDDFEVKPSSNNWDKITEQLDEKPKNKTSLFWMAAASVVVVLGIGIGLYTKPEAVIKLRGNHDEVMAKVSSEKGKKDTPAFKNKVEQHPAESQSVPFERGDSKIHDENSGSLKKGKNTLAVYPSGLKSQKFIPADATITPIDDVLNTKKNDGAGDIVSVKPLRTPTVTEQMLAEEEKNNIGPQVNSMAAANVAHHRFSGDGAPAGKGLKIKSVGDLVNFVVAKVDKREDKIIQLSKTDESDNEITGINLGLFKFRKVEK